MTMDMKELLALTQSKRVLLVEDDEDIRVSMETLFEDLFQEATVAADGQDGWEKFQAGSFDLVITDINMPKMDGIELLKNIRTIDAHIPVVMLTAHNDMKYVIGASQHRTSGYIIKPLTLDSLGEALIKIEEARS